MRQTLKQTRIKMYCKMTQLRHQYHFREIKLCRIVEFLNDAAIVVFK